VRIEQGLAGYAVSNIGGTTNIVSSIFDASGGLHNGPGSTMSIVNTAWSGRFGSFSGQTDQIHNQGTMRIQASTFWVPDTQNCESGSPNPPNVCPSHAAPLLNDGGSMELKGTAVGTDVSQVDPSGNSTPVTGSEVVNGGDTWIGPTRDESLPLPGTAGWINIFVQPNPDTGSPGLDGIMPVINVLGDGLLIDRIDCNNDPLINPIDNTQIDADVLGNARCDANGKRNIGAVQTQTAPHLVVNGIGDGRVDLSWVAPANCPETEVIGGYKLYRRLVGDSFGAPVVIDGAGTLRYSDISVTNGIQYEYEIKARCGIDSGGFIEISESAASNVAAATPIGPIGTPVPTATPGDGQVDLTWTIPNLGGRTLLNYFITYFPVGTTDYGFEATLTPAVTITGLTNGTDYQFMVFAITTSNESSDAGLATAIPLAPPSTASFLVSKSYSDSNTETVDVTLTCSGEVSSQQTLTIAPGNPTSIVLVGFASGATRCEITESDGPVGYRPSFDNGDVVSASSCVFDNVISDSDYSCAITNTIFYERVPTMNQYGVALLAFLMLGLAAVGVRRFT